MPLSDKARDRTGKVVATNLWRALRIVSVYALIGPLVGLVVFAAGVGALAVLSGRPEGMWLSPFLLLYGPIFAHFVGVIWAIVAGICAAILSTFTPTRPLWIGPASGLVSFLGAYLSGGVRLPEGPASPIGPVVDGFSTGFAVVMLLVHVVSATACWKVAQRFARTPSAPSI